MTGHIVKFTFMLFIAIPTLVLGQLRVAVPFSDHMVIQQSQPIPIWGKGMPGARVIVTMGMQKKTVQIGEDSTWRLLLPSMQSDGKHYLLSVNSGKESFQFKDILLGDVWLCLGQSNMEFPLEKEQHWPELKRSKLSSQIRFLNPTPVGRGVYGIPYNDSLVQRLKMSNFYQWNGWQVCDSNTLSSMTAVGFYFAKKVSEITAIPIGLIHLSIGGAPLETFIRKELLCTDSVFNTKVKGNWLNNAALPIWIRERGIQNVGNVGGIPIDGEGPDHAYKPGFAYANGVQKILPLPIKGVLFYQGESNAQELERVHEYAELFRLLIKDYRINWHQPHMPFYYAQLSSIDTLKYKSQLWPLFRDEQRKLMQKVSDVGMAVTSDVGARNDVHPVNKKAVGERLARWALFKTYHHSIFPSGPIVSNAYYKRGSVMIVFKEVAKGLKTSDDQAVRGFSLDGKKYVQAYIANKAIMIPVSYKPSYVYYGWQPFSLGNLINSENLPTSTFKIKVK